MPVTLAELLVADPPEAWRAAGFTVDDDGTSRVGTVRIRLLGDAAGKGVMGWALRGLPEERADVDGVPTTATDEPAAEPAGHPNGTTHIDHVVLLAPDLTRTVAALGDIGLEPRRERDGELGGGPVRQVFYRLGEVILEVVGAPGVTGEGPATIWGLTHTVADIDAAAALLGEHAAPVKDAVQPGRRITTLRTRELGMSVRTALISPHVKD
ncbi:glyoxalase [Nocardioides aromaticivorans]|uniref:Glyoxalase n=1 Tax=Nocardioides aromaticivorans TaxID=200618 RepID=A0ABX7PI11_9ACTN|nr:glyoxalase [Nocardioides aromaticivorans]QSR25315.1 glyoxalase [Nocardioides aromaticivorans]